MGEDRQPDPGVADERSRLSTAATGGEAPPRPDLARRRSRPSTAAQARASGLHWRVARGRPVAHDGPGHRGRRAGRSGGHRRRGPVRARGRLDPRGSSHRQSGSRRVRSSTPDRGSPGPAGRVRCRGGEGRGRARARPRSCRLAGDRGDWPSAPVRRGAAAGESGGACPPGGAGAAAGAPPRRARGSAHRGRALARRHLGGHREHRLQRPPVAPRRGGCRARGGVARAHATAASPGRHPRQPMVVHRRRRAADVPLGSAERRSPHHVAAPGRARGGDDGDGRQRRRAGARDGRSRRDGDVVGPHRGHAHVAQARSPRWARQRGSHRSGRIEDRHRQRGLDRRGVARDLEDDPAGARGSGEGHRAQSGRQVGADRERRRKGAPVGSQPADFPD